MPKERVDVLAYKQGLFETREQAKRGVMAGLVVNVINGERYDKPGEKIDDGTELKLKGEKLKYVSRGGLKLEKALQVFEISVEGQTTIDIGASTGGFTDVIRYKMVRNLSMRLMLVPINWFGNFVRMNVFVAWSSIISAMQNWRILQKVNQLLLLSTLALSL
ncbi:Hemolysin A [Streptococcus pasteurianus]|nr:Hemolysin A [Streptococcus pasteurianus]